MSAVDRVFDELRAAGRKAFVPFITAGDPDLAITALLLAELARRGASVCELGIPYSDPIADGPVIQSSYTRALANKIKLAGILDMARQTASKLQSPVVTMASYAILYRHGLERYVNDACEAGIAGAIVPDLPVEESGGLVELCRRADFSLIQLVTPQTSRERAIRIANTSTGFIYYVSVTGITGEREALPQPVIEQVSWLREQTKTPICVGFGISRPEQVRALSAVADGVIVGSALVRRVAEGAGKPREQLVREVGDYAASLVAALATSKS
ncbi:MAG: tryptophan synthase subunit alpha [Pirellulales bacterium]|nr:tryptophan synthase subunit alpha [Pirellulales bacterium]